MAFLTKLSEIGSAISSKGQEAANKAKELTATSEIKSKITTAENSIRQTYLEIGEKVFTEHSDWIFSNYPELVEKVKGLQSDIAQYNQDIANLKQSTLEANAAVQEAHRARVAAAQAAEAEEAARKAEAAQAAMSANAAPSDSAQSDPAPSAETTESSSETTGGM